MGMVAISKFIGNTLEDFFADGHTGHIETERVIPIRGEGEGEILLGRECGEGVEQVGILLNALIKDGEGDLDIFGAVRLQPGGTIDRAGGMIAVNERLNGVVGGKRLEVISRELEALQEEMGACEGGLPMMEVIDVLFGDGMGFGQFCLESGYGDQVGVDLVDQRRLVGEETKEALMGKTMDFPKQGGINLERGSGRVPEGGEHGERCAVEERLKAVVEGFEVVGGIGAEPGKFAASSEEVGGEIAMIFVAAVAPLTGSKGCVVSFGQILSPALHVRKCRWGIGCEPAPAIVTGENPGGAINLAFVESFAALIERITGAVCPDDRNNGGMQAVNFIDAKTMFSTVDAVAPEDRDFPTGH